MTYNQALNYIVQRVRENHNREITGNILQDVLVVILNYIRDQDIDILNEFNILKDIVDNISISQNLNVFEGNDDPNIIPPTEAFDAPDIYVQTNLDKIWIYTGSEWFDITQREDINSVITEFNISETFANVNELVNYINNLNPAREKDKNENWVIKTNNKTYLFVGASKGKYGLNENQITEDNLLDITDGSSSASATYTADIPVILSGNKTLGRYTNGQTIPAKDKTVQEVMELIAQEYLTPTFSAFSIKDQPAIIEVGSTISGNKEFTFQLTQAGNVKQNSITIKDQTEDEILASDLPKTPTTKAVDVGTVKRTTAGNHTWRIMATNTNEQNLQRDYSVTWGYRRFAGTMASKPTSGEQIRTALLSSSVLNSGNTFHFATGSSNRFFVVALAPGKTLVSARNTDTNENLTSGFVLSNITTMPDAEGSTYNANVYIFEMAVPYGSSNNIEIKTT